MILSYNCAPTLIYIGFSLIQIIIDIYKGLISNAFIKFIVMIIFSIILNILCNLGYKVIAWFLVFIPIIMMTLISTLLLKVFGINPDKKNLKKQIKNIKKDISNNLVDENNKYYLDNSNNYLGGANLLNQQKNAYFYDKLNRVKRVNRDKHRKELYNKVEKFYKLSSSNKDLYDLSNNQIKYNIVNKLINKLGENYFTKQVSSFLYINYPFKYSNLSYNSIPNIITRLNDNYKDKLNKIDKNNFKSYEKIYDKRYLLDGQLLFKRDKYQKIKNKYPNYTDISINRIIDNEWNNLTKKQKEKWNTDAEKKENENNINYNPFNFSSYRPELTRTNQIILSKYSNNMPCPINETKESFKQKTGFNCYEICPPGKEKNSTGLCVRPCPSGQERKSINSNCENI
mgnify:FL=1